jgi:hypothetical protein
METRALVFNFPSIAQRPDAQHLITAQICANIFFLKIDPFNV